MYNRVLSSFSPSHSALDGSGTSILNDYDKINTRIALEKLSVYNKKSVEYLAYGNLAASIAFTEMILFINYFLNKQK